MATRRRPNTRGRRARKERVKAELRQFVLLSCMVLGLLLAMPWAFSHEAPEGQCEKGSGICWDRFYDHGGAILARVGVGVGLGLALGFALCLWMPGLRRSGH